MPYRHPSLTKQQMLQVLDEIYEVTHYEEALAAKEDLNRFEGVVRRILNERGDNYLKLRKMDSNFPNGIDRRWKYVS